MMGRLWSLAVDAAGAACAELLDTLWPSEATGTAEALLVEAEEARDVFEPLPVPETMVGFYDCPCGGCIEIFADDDPTEARARFDLWADRHRDCRIECEDRGCDAVHSPTDCPGCSDLCCPGPPASAPGPLPPVDADGPTPSSPEGGVGHPSTPVVDVSQPAATRNGETVGAAGNHTSGGGVDRPLSEWLYEAAGYIRLHPCGQSCNCNAYARDVLAPGLRDIAAQMRAIDE